MIQSLIDKQDTFELVRDQIANILVTEIANQMSLATAGGKDPALWKIRVYAERSHPFEQWLNCSGTTDLSPICNVWFDSMPFNKSTSDVVKRQHADGAYNLDIYAYAPSTPDGDGHKSGDVEAMYKLHRGVRLVRNILMASEYVNLGFAAGVIWDRWINSVTIYQPEFDGRPVQNVVGARISFSVGFNELSPQYEAEVLEYLSTTIRRAEDGEIIAQFDVDYTAP